METALSYKEYYASLPDRLAGYRYDALLKAYVDDDSSINHIVYRPMMGESIANIKYELMGV